MVESSLASTLQDWLAQKLDQQVIIRWGSSRTAPLRSRLESMPGLSAKRVLRLHLHHMFRDADAATREALLVWSSGRRQDAAARATLQTFMRDQLDRKPAKPRVRKLDSQGRTHDLGALAASLFEGPFLAEFGDGKARPNLTWGRRARSRSRRSMRLGCYMPQENLVRIHAALDQPGVPAWFVRFILFHEILHAAVPSSRGPSGRRVHHGPQFKRRESAYEDYERALRWERANLPRILVSSRTGKPMAG